MTSLGTPADILQALGAALVAKSGTWLGALVASLLGSVFAAGRSLLVSMPLTRVEALADESGGRKRKALRRYMNKPPRIRMRCTSMASANRWPQSRAKKSTPSSLAASAWER